MHAMIVKGLWIYMGIMLVIFAVMLMQPDDDDPDL